MKNLLIKGATVVALASTLAVMSMASPQHKTKHMSQHTSHHKTMAMKCPYCGMTLSPKRTKATPIAIWMHGKKMYTCTKCEAQVKRANMKQHHPPMVRTHTAAGHN